MTQMRKGKKGRKKENKCAKELFEKKQWNFTSKLNLTLLQIILVKL